jgi:hypothetical protein
MTGSDVRHTVCFTEKVNQFTDKVNVLLVCSLSRRQVIGYFESHSQVTLFRLPIKRDVQMIINTGLKIVTEYLNCSQYSSGETPTTAGIANMPDEVHEMLIRWSSHS